MYQEYKLLHATTQQKFKYQFCVVCAGAISVGGAYYGQGSGPILSSINCGGNESNLTLCSRGSVGQRDCHHGRDVGVICQGTAGLAIGTVTAKY